MACNFAVPGDCDGNVRPVDQAQVEQRSKICFHWQWVALAFKSCSNLTQCLMTFSKSCKLYFVEIQDYSFLLFFVLPSQLLSSGRWSTNLNTGCQNWKAQVSASSLPFGSLAFSPSRLSFSLGLIRQLHNNTITQFYQVGFKSGVMSVLTVPILPQPIGNIRVLW